VAYRFFSALCARYARAPIP